MSETDALAYETDPRFPSGPWLGFYLQKEIPGRHLMEISLNFRFGEIRGEGRDPVGPFTMTGRYDLADGKCYWTKHYEGRHDVFYQGYNEGRGVWGVWEFPAYEFSLASKGGFHIWPKGMGHPTDDQLGEAAEPPLVVEATLEETVPIGA